MVEKVGIEILATEMGVASSCFDGENTALDVEKGNIESTSTEIVDENVALLARFAGPQTVSNSGRRGLVDDAKDVEAGNSTSVLGSLTLVIIEVGGDSDDCLIDLLANLGLGDLLHLQAGTIVSEKSTMGFLCHRTFKRIMDEISWGEKDLVSPR